MASLSPELREALCRETDDTWRLLTKQLTYYAACLLRGRRWRGLENGVPPDGHSAESVAGEAIARLFAGTDWQPKGKPYHPEELRFELMRIAQNTVRNLARRKENATVSSEPDLRHRDEEISEESFFSNFRSDSPPADAEAERDEAKAALTKFMGEFKVFLGSEKLLVRLFECIHAGILKRDEQAAFLGISAQDVTNARKRLDRRLEDFAKAHPNYPDALIQEIKNA
jgi:hypothetical protein